MNELYSNSSKTKKIDKCENNIENKDALSENERTIEDSDETGDDSEDVEEFTYDSYKSDEEYLRMAKLVKNIYYCIAGGVIVLLGILYIIMFKL